jgi:phytoene dehydrogenase-like protein
MSMRTPSVEDAEEGGVGGEGGLQSAGRSPTAIVIGAGFGGISAAGRLARAGYSVTCVEKHATPGGRCCEIVEKGHRFDVGPSIILVPSAYREAFTAMGDDLDRHLDFIRVDPTYKIHFHDGTSLELTADLQRMEVLCAVLHRRPTRPTRPARATSARLRALTAAPPARRRSSRPSSAAPSRATCRCCCRATTICTRPSPPSRTATFTRSSSFSPSKTGCSSGN